MTEMEELKIYVQSCNERIFHLELELKEMRIRNERQAEMLKAYEDENKKKDGKK